MTNVNITSESRIPRGLKNLVYIRDGKVCRFCGSKENLGICHLIPKSKGGRTEISNLGIACFRCRRKKGKGTDTELIRNLYLESLTELKGNGDTGIQVEVIYCDGEKEKGKIKREPMFTNETFIHFFSGKRKEYICVYAIKKLIRLK